MIDRQVLLGQSARLVDKTQSVTGDKGTSAPKIILKGQIADCKEYRDGLAVVIHGTRPGTVTIDDNGINVHDRNQQLEIQEDIKGGQQIRQRRGQPQS
ncbi:MAG: hypothetical protein ABIB97_00485 [Patescibacteria group bacterium]